MRKLLLVLFPILLSCVSMADKIVLKDGTEVEGEIIKETDSEYLVLITVGSISMRVTYPKREVEKVERGKAPKNVVAELMKNLDRSSPESYRAAIQALKEQGDVILAGKLVRELKELERRLWKEENARWLCPVCGGDKMLPCPNCGGKGFALEQVICKGCGGATVIRCTRCNNGRVPCPGKCEKFGLYKGQIRKTRVVPTMSETVYSSGYKRTYHHQRTETYYKTCPICRGTGDKACPECHGNPIRMCRKCNGSGRVREKVRCPHCTRGRIRCGVCDGTGIDADVKTMLSGE